MFDETSNASNISQLTLLIRYSDCEKVYESFLKFIDIRSKDSSDKTSFARKKEGLTSTGVKTRKAVIS